MSILRKSIGSLVRSPLRTGAIVAILAVSIGLALIMLTVHGATENQLGSIGENVGTEISVRPAGSYGLMGGGEPLDEELVDQLSDITHVVSVQESTQTQYTGDSLESAVDPGTLGGGGGTFPSGGFRMGIMVMGFDAATENPTLMGDAKMEIVEGRYFTTDENDVDVMVVGQDLADANGLEIGSTVDIEGTSVTVIGIYDSGQVFGNNMLVMPIDTVQRLFALEGVTSVTVVADDVDNVDGVAEAIREVFDEDTADVVTATDMYERIGESVTNASKTSQVAMIAAISVAAVVILFSVTLMVRQRVKEIGILKAIGASNWRVGLQFGVETVVISLVAAAIGALITFPLAQTVGNMLISDPTTTQTATGFAGRIPGGGPFGGGATTSFAGIDVAVSPEVFLYALGIAVGLAVAASIFPLWYISRVRPAEVLRNE
jgi:putative ABC transport system permease protein